jgi:hypothetical protein
MDISPNKFTEEKKQEWIAAMRAQVQEGGMKNPIIEFVEGPLFCTVRAWGSRRNRRSGEWPNGEVSMKLYPSPDDVAGPLARAIADGETGFAILPEVGVVRFQPSPS